MLVVGGGLRLLSVLRLITQMMMMVTRTTAPAAMPTMMYRDRPDSCGRLAEKRKLL